MGAALHLPLARLESPDVQLRWLSDNRQIELCASVLDSYAEPLETFRRASRTALLFGSEGHGLANEIVSLCQRQVTIPMPPGIDSLNAAIAAGIFLHHLSRSTPHERR
jgi:tRNA G18 (ribose-2'-O)-methylase SpoU